MIRKTHYWIGFVMLVLLSACRITSVPAPSTQAPVQTGFPDYVNTTSVDIVKQVKKTYNIDGVHADNQFEGARLNGFEQIDQNRFRATISPENTPINESAYYGMRLWADTVRDVELELYYTYSKHRYIPKISFDREYWIAMDSTDYDTLQAGNICTIQLQLSPDTLYLSGQELLTSSDNEAWVNQLARLPNVHKSTIGTSQGDRSLYCLDIYEGTKHNKPAIIIIGRQHPPEVTGSIAEYAFVEQLLDTSNVISKTFMANHRVLVYPMLNPDGVDEGHWRHSLGGVDMNRDWSRYNQKEIKVAVDHMVRSIAEGNNQVLVGLDFHSTQQDLYYTLTPNLKSHIFPFKDLWIQGLDDAIEDYTPDDRPFDLNTPISKGWFYLQFGAEGITYEVGDETARTFVRSKARHAANEMMKFLVLRQ